MNLEVITKDDLQSFKQDLLNEIKQIFRPAANASDKRWLKSNEVRQLLGCSHGTLQNLRINGTLTPTKIGGTWYYSSEQIMSLLSQVP